MDQVLLKWDGGHPEVLARIKDADGCWIASKELREKLCSNILEATWYMRVKKGKHHILSIGKPWSLGTRLQCLAASGCSCGRHQAGHARGSRLPYGCWCL